MQFIDFEVTKFDWLCVIIDPTKRAVHKICNEPEALQRVYDENKEDIWVGYNIRHYDQYILKTILCGLDPWECNDWIINRNLPGWQFSNLLKKISLIFYDVQPGKDKSLKQLEGFQGHNIHESSIDFTIDRPMNQAEIDEMMQYCENDVMETMNVFGENINDFNAILWLVKEFGFPLSYVSKTKAQISAEILECEAKDFGDEWDISILPCIRLDDPVYKAAEDWFLSKENHWYKRGTEKNKFFLDVAGVRHDFGWGGIHGALSKYHYRCDNNHLMIHVDVESYYPRLMIWHNLLTRAARKPERFVDIFNRRMQLKHEGKKKEQAPLKIVINGTYGISKDELNKAYDPRNANLVCVNGQLMLLDLIEKLESLETFELIQSNTDGLIIKIHKKDFERLDDICYEWESRCDMKLAFDYIKEIYQKDVNNYVFVQYDGKIERKGSYVKELSPMDNDLPILNKAVLDYMLHGIPVEQTVNECDDLMMFQNICKLTGNYNYVTWNGKKYYNKCYRIFASKRRIDGPVQKAKKVAGKLRLDKFANTSEHSFIENGDVTNAHCPAYLDKQWYIDIAQKRLEQYGVG